MAVKDTISDLGDYLFEELERLNDPELDDKQLDLETARARAMNETASQILSVARTQVDVMRACSDARAHVPACSLPRLLCVANDQVMIRDRVRQTEEG